MTGESVRNSEVISNYGKLRLIQADINNIILEQKLVVTMPHDSAKGLSNSIDQIEQALEKIKADTTDTIVLEIMNEIDSEITY